MTNDNTPDTATQVKRILTGSCSPACDLLALVDDGLLTASEAGDALRRSGRKVADIHSAAAFERDNMRRLDI